MALSLYIPPQWIKIIAPLVIICNYAPPFIAQQLLRRSSMDLSLSSSMAERLGLFTIIVFGEVVLGVVNGISNAEKLNFTAWINFALALSIVFALWWIFFTMTSNRIAKTGFVKATLLELLCVPTLMSLGLIAACSLYILDPQNASSGFHFFFSIALTVFLAGISLMMGLLEYPDIVGHIIRPVRISLFVTACVFLAFFLVARYLELSTMYFLLMVIIILIAEIAYLNSLYYNLNVEEKAKSSDESVKPE